MLSLVFQKEGEMEERNDIDKMDEVMLPGFRFHPTDEELVGFYLKRKVQHRPLSVELIKQIDIYKYDPWDLPRLAATGEKEWYFYCPRDRKYRNSARPNRVTGAGFWKATGTDRPIYSSEGTTNKCIGLKKSLVFYKGRAAKGIKTDWMMHEFRLPSLTESTHPKRYMDKTIPANDSWAICRIFKKTNSTTQRALSYSWVSSPFSETTATFTPTNNNTLIQQGAQSNDTISSSMQQHFSCNNNNNNDFHHLSSYNKSIIHPTAAELLLPTNNFMFSTLETPSGPVKENTIIDISPSSSMLLNMATSTSMLGNFGTNTGSSSSPQQEQYCNGVSIISNQEHNETAAAALLKYPMINDDDGDVDDDQYWGRTVRSLGFQPGLGLSMPVLNMINDEWKKSNFCLWDSNSSQSSEISTTYSSQY